MSEVSVVYEIIRQMLDSDSYNGNVNLYLMRYRTTTDKENNSKINFPFFYNAIIGKDVQKNLLENFDKSKDKYSGDEFTYLVNGETTEGVGVISTSDFENVREIYENLKADESEYITQDMSKMSISTLKCYIVKVCLPDNSKLYFFGKIKNYAQLQRKELILKRKEVNSSELKKFDIEDTIGFSLDIPVVIYNDKVYIAEINNFETIFAMKEYFKAEASSIVDSVLNSDKVNENLLKAVKEYADKDSRIAKKVMKLKYKSQNVKAVYDHLSNETYDRIVKDENLEKYYDNVTFQGGILSVKDTQDHSQIKQFINFIADTAKKGIISELTSSEPF